MRTRALLTCLAAAMSVLAVGASGAPAATLFTNTAHTTRVAIGSTSTATVVGNFDITSTSFFTNRCTGGQLQLVVIGNNDATGVDLRVTSGALTQCDQYQIVPTFTPSWTLRITGSGSTSGPNTRYAASIDGVHLFDIPSFPAVLTGNLTTGLTALQPTAGTSPITINLANAGSVTTHALGDTETFDGNLRLTTPWSLTN